MKSIRHGLDLYLVATAGLLAACASTGGPTDSSTRPAAAGEEAPAFQAPIDLIPAALGPHRWTITTSSDRAQAYFDQGLQLRYAYGVDDSARSFREARIAALQAQIEAGSYEVDATGIARRLLDDGLAL